LLWDFNYFNRDIVLWLLISPEMVDLIYQWRGTLSLLQTPQGHIVDSGLSAGYAVSSVEGMIDQAEALVRYLWKELEEAEGNDG